MNSNIRYYFYSKKRKYEDNDLLDVSVYKERNKYKCISVLDDKYIDDQILGEYLINKYNMQVYDDLNLNNLNIFSSINDYNESHINYSKENIFIFNKQLFINDLYDLINDYKNNIYDCIEIIFPKIESKYYLLDDLQQIINILHNEFDSDESILEKIL